MQKHNKVSKQHCATFFLPSNNSFKNNFTVHIGGNGAAAIDTVLLVDPLEDYRTLLTFLDTLS